MALQHSTEYSLSTVSDSGPWGAWVQQPEHAVEDVGPHTMTIPGLPVGIYWARLRITSLPLDANSSVVISEVFSFDVVSASSYLAQAQAAQSSASAASVILSAATSEAQVVQTESGAGSIAITGAISATQALQTEMILPLTNDKTGDLAETQLQQTEATSAAVLTYATTSGTQKVQTESVAVTYTPAVSIPAAPTITSVTPGDAQNVIDLGASSGATSYNLYWSTTETVAANIKASGTPIVGASDPYMHSGLTNGTTYNYVETAVNAAGESGPSSVVSGVPAAPVSEITFVAAGTAFNGITSGFDTIAVPGAAGDFLILYANSTSIIATPAGWTAVNVGVARFYYRFSDGSPSVTLDTSFDTEMGLGVSTLIRAFAFRGINAATPFDVSPIVVAGPATNAASISTPITTVSAKAMVVALSGSSPAVPGITGTSGDTPNWIGNVRNTSFNSNLSLAYGLQSVAGAKSAVFNFEGNVSANTVNTTVLALKPV